MGYVKFTGEFNKLKSMGFEFQKLYARNYMQWHKNHIRVWKRGHDITHDEFNLYKFIKFMDTNPELGERSWGKEKWHVCYKFYSNPKRNEYDFYPYNEENNTRFRDHFMAVHEHVEDETKPMPEYLGDTFVIDDELLEFVKEWREMGWLELVN